MSEQTEQTPELPEAVRELRKRLEGAGAGKIPSDTLKKDPILKAHKDDIEIAQNTAEAFISESALEHQKHIVNVSAIESLDFLSDEAKRHLLSQETERFETKIESKYRERFPKPLSTDTADDPETQSAHGIVNHVEGTWGAAVGGAIAFTILVSFVASGFEPNEFVLAEKRVALVITPIAHVVAGLLAFASLIAFAFNIGNRIPFVIQMQWIVVFCAAASIATFHWGAFMALGLAAASLAGYQIFTNHVLQQTASKRLEQTE